MHFARKLHVNVNTLRAYEKGRALPNFELLERLCVVFSVSATWILTGEGPVYLQAGHPEGAEMTTGTTHSCERHVCDYCPRLEARLEMLEQERREKEAEIRTLMMENRQLWRENSELREKLVRLELQAK